MSTQVNEQVAPKPQKPQKTKQRKWPLAVLAVVMMYIAPTVNSILQQFLAARWTIEIHISGFQLNVALLICEIIFTWLIMGISFIIGMMALPVAVVSLLTKRETPLSRPIYIVLMIVFPLLWVWNYFIEKWYYRNDEEEE